LSWLVAETAARHLSSRAFVAAARREAASAATAAAASFADGSDEPSDPTEETRASRAAEEAAASVARTLQAGYATLAENALVMLRSAAASEGSLDAESAAKAERAGRRVLAALDGLLAPGAYLRAIAPLLEHDDGRVRRKALRLVAHRLRAAAAAEAARARGAGKSQSRRARSRARAQAHRQASREKRKNASKTRLDASLDEKHVNENEDSDDLEEELADEVAAAASLMPRLASLAGADAGASTRAAALGALEAAAVRFGDVFVVSDDASNAKIAALSQTRKASAAFAAPLLSTTPAMVDALCAPARAVVAAAANATAAVVRALGPRALPALPSAVPALFAAARKAAATLAGALDESSGVSGGVSEAVLAARDDEGHVLVACLRAVTALMDRLGGFLSPHLSDVLALLLSPSLVFETKDTELTTPEKEQTKTAATTAAAHAAALREALPRATPPRLLLGPLDDAMRAALGDADAGEERGGRVSASAAAAALRMAASCVASSPPPSQQPELRARFHAPCSALDVRRSHPASFDGVAIDRVESAAAEAFVTAASSQTESAFAPTLATATEWAKARASDPEAARARLSALFCVASALADQLRGVFTPLATPILDLAAAALDPAADIAVASAKRRRKEKRENRDETNTDSSSRDAFRAECDAWRVRARALGAVRRICAHDSGEIIDAARFNQLHPLVTACLTAKPPSVGGKSRDVSSFPTPSDLDDLHDDAALAPGGVGAEAAACVAALIAAAPDDTLWKPAHRGTLQATRDASPRARRVAVAALAATTARLEEEFLTLLPESIPYLSELFEDPDEGVEGAARELTATLAELSGEDLKSLMATGGE
jgi:U3 small nucleolar RNA-associated protein 10